MEVFDGFIAAVNAEFHIKFESIEDGTYTTTIEFENDREKNVLVMLAWDESEDRMIHFYSTIAPLTDVDHSELFTFALKSNGTLDYGALAIIDGSLVLRNSILLEECEPKRFLKSVVYIAAKADELVEELVEKGTLSL